MSSRRVVLEAALLQLAPRLPRHETLVVLDHALGSIGLKTASPERAAWLSLVAYARHERTDYDELLAEGYDVESARHFVLEELEQVLAGWGVTRPVVEDDDDDEQDDEDELR